MAFERGAGAERDHGNPGGGAGADHIRDLLGRLGEEDGVRSGADACQDSSRPCRSSTDSLVETRVP